jgi:hypothetical protein
MTEDNREREHNKHPKKEFHQSVPPRMIKTTRERRDEG